RQRQLEAGTPESGCDRGEGLALGRRGPQIDAEYGGCASLPQADAEPVAPGRERQGERHSAVGVESCRGARDVARVEQCEVRLVGAWFLRVLARGERRSRVEPLSGLLFD